MLEQDNDRLEQFFRKAAAKADITFNEEDWKKLEARLEAADLSGPVLETTGRRMTHTVIVAVLLLVSALVWMGSEDGSQKHEQAAAVVDPLLKEEVQSQPKSSPRNDVLSREDRAHIDRHANPALSSAEELQSDWATSGAEPASGKNMPVHDADNSGGLRREASIETLEKTIVGLAVKPDEKHPDETRALAAPGGLTGFDVNNDGERSPQMAVSDDANEKLGDRQSTDEQHTNRQWNDTTVSDPERNKQKAVVELPGAEEEKTREALTMVQEEHASDQKKHVSTSRLSLLLSFAPDFSGTSMAVSSAPGKAFGAMLHYHAFDRWSISAGVIKNYKQYTGSGEDYRPPTGYWKYYTNGIIPETIEGACDILEFPLMIQYNVVQREKGRWNVGVGASSYLMQSESYRYNFTQPNPGAKDGWYSKESSRFFMNMLNFTVGYEHQVIPGLMLGVEPYAKVPLEEIGWSNLKLFSSGVSFTLRYTLLHKNTSVPVRSRGPD